MLSSGSTWPARRRSAAGWHSGRSRIESMIWRRSGRARRRPPLWRPLLGGRGIAADSSPSSSCRASARRGRQLRRSSRPRSSLSNFTAVPTRRTSREIRHIWPRRPPAPWPLLSHRRESRRECRKNARWSAARRPAPSRETSVSAIESCRPRRSASLVSSKFSTADCSAVELAAGSLPSLRAVLGRLGGQRRQLRLVGR